MAHSFPAISSQTFHQPMDSNMSQAAQDLLKSATVSEKEREGRLKTQKYSTRDTV